MVYGSIGQVFEYLNRFKARNHSRAINSGLNAVQTRRSGDEQLVQVRAAKAEIGRFLRKVDDTQAGPVRIKQMNAIGSIAQDVIGVCHFHPVRHPFATRLLSFNARPECVVIKVAVFVDVKTANAGVRAVVDKEMMLIA